MRSCGVTGILHQGGHPAPAESRGTSADSINGYARASVKALVAACAFNPGFNCSCCKTAAPLPPTVVGDGFASTLMMVVSGVVRDGILTPAD